MTETSVESSATAASGTTATAGLTESGPDASAAGPVSRARRVPRATGGPAAGPPAPDPLPPGSDPSPADEGETDAADDEAAETEATLADPEVVRKRKLEAIGVFGLRELTREAAKERVLEKALSGRKLTTKESALFMAQQLDTGDLYVTATDGKHVKLTLNEQGRYTDPEGNLVDYNLAGGNPLVLPRFTDRVSPSEEVEVFSDGEAAVSKILGINENGDYICQFESAVLGRVMTEDGKPVEEGGIPITRAVSKDLIMALQVQAEMDTYSTVAPENEVYKTYLDALSVPYDDFAPDAAFDGVLEKAAIEEGVPTSHAIRAIIEEKYGNDKRNQPPEVADLIDKFDTGGAIVLSADQFSEAMTTLGVNAGVFDTEIERLTREKNHASQERIAAIDREVAVLTKFQKAWLDAEAAGGRTAPLNYCYREIMKGRINFTTLAKAVAEGTRNPQALVNFFKENPQLMSLANLSAEDQQTLAGLAAKEGMGWIWSLLIILPAAIAAGVVGTEDGFLKAGKGLLQLQ